MKKNIITILLALVAVAGWAQVPLESVKELTMKSEYFNHERQLLIYTPDNYPNFDQRCHLCVRCTRPHDVRSCTLFAQHRLQARPRRRQKHEFHHCRHLLTNPLGHQLFSQPRLPAHAPAWQHWAVQGGLLLRQIARPEEIRQE